MNGFDTLRLKTLLYVVKKVSRCKIVGSTRLAGRGEPKDSSVIHSEESYITSVEMQVLFVLFRNIKASV